MFPSSLFKITNNKKIYFTFNDAQCPHHHTEAPIEVSCRFLCIHKSMNTSPLTQETNWFFFSPTIYSTKTVIMKAKQNKTKAEQRWNHLILLPYLHCKIFLFLGSTKNHATMKNIKKPHTEKLALQYEYVWSWRKKSRKNKTKIVSLVVST